MLFLLLITQCPQIIMMKDYYSGEGVIFDKTTHYPFEMIDYKEPYTPTILDIKKAEDILFKDYYTYRVNILSYFKQDVKTVNQKFKNPDKVKKYFWKYNRQYLGYVNTSNDTVIYIGLLNFKNKKKAQENFKGWKQKILFGVGDYYYENQIMIEINLTKKDFIYKLE